MHCLSCLGTGVGCFVDCFALLVGLLVLCFAMVAGVGCDFLVFWVLFRCFEIVDCYVLCLICCGCGF